MDKNLHVRTFMLEKNDAATGILLLTTSEAIVRLCACRAYSNFELFQLDHTLSFLPNGCAGHYDFGLAIAVWSLQVDSTISQQS